LGEEVSKKGLMMKEETNGATLIVPSVKVRLVLQELDQTCMIVRRKQS
jgi:hypothetical protein